MLEPDVVLADGDAEAVDARHLAGDHRADRRVPHRVDSQGTETDGTQSLTHTHSTHWTLKLLTSTFTYSDGTNSSRRPSAKTACSLGPRLRSDRMVNTTLSLIRLSSCLQWSVRSWAIKLQ